VNPETYNLSLSEEDACDIINSLWILYNNYNISDFNRYLTKDECEILKKRKKEILRQINILSKRLKNSGCRLRYIK